MTAPAAPRFAEFALGLNGNDLPDVVARAAKEHLLDAVGCALAAVGLGEAPAAARVALERGGVAQATGIGCPTAMPSASAALVNGTLAHGLDFDDTHEAAICHVSTVVGPAAIAAAEAVHASGDELIAAFVAGSEIVCRIGMASPGAFHDRGFHPTAVCGIFGATAAAGRLYGLDAEHITAALGLAGSFASGLFEYLADGSPTKPIHAGWAAQAALSAVELARAGARGPDTVLEGRFGLYASHTDVAPDLEAQLCDLGLRWETPRIAFKAYPACHFMHGAVEAAAAAAGATPTNEIEEIRVRVPRSAVALVLEPAAEKRRPRTPYDAKFSLPYSVAARLVHDRLDAASYTAEAIRDPVVLALAERVQYETWTDEETPGPFAGEAELRRDDRPFSAHSVASPTGAPENPMPTAAVLAKFHANAALAMPRGPAEVMAEQLLMLEHAPDVCRVFAPLATAGRNPEHASSTHSEAPSPELT